MPNKLPNPFIKSATKGLSSTGVVLAATIAATILQRSAPDICGDIDNRVLTLGLGGIFFWWKGFIKHEIWPAIRLKFLS